MLCVLGDSWKLAPGFIHLLYVPFADFALYLFTVIKSQHKYNYVLSPVRSSGNHQTWSDLEEP